MRSVPLKNPFVYGETVSGDNFCDRAREMKELIADIKNGQNVIIFSPRRYGKTSLIKQALRKAKAQGILTFYIDLYPAINKGKFIEIYAGAISSGIPGGARQVVKKIKEYLPRIIPKVVMDDQAGQSYTLLSFFPSGGNLEISTRAINEYLGIIWYRLRGRIGA